MGTIKVRIEFEIEDQHYHLLEAEDVLQGIARQFKEIVREHDTQVKYPVRLPIKVNRPRQGVWVNGRVRVTDKNTSGGPWSGGPRTDMVLKFYSKGWHTIQEGARRLKYSENSVHACLRALRHPLAGGYRVSKRQVEEPSYKNSQVEYEYHVSKA